MREGEREGESGGEREGEGEGEREGERDLSVTSYVRERVLFQVFQTRNMRINTHIYM